VDPLRPRPPRFLWHPSFCGVGKGFNENLRFPQRTELSLDALTSIPWEIQFAISVGRI